MSIKSSKTTILTPPFDGFARANAVQRVGVTLPSNFIGVYGLEVLADSDDPRFKKGHTVYLRDGARVHGWAKEVFPVDGREAMLVPVDFVVWVDDDPKAVRGLILPVPPPKKVEPKADAPTEAKVIQLPLPASTDPTKA